MTNFIEFIKSVFICTNPCKCLIELKLFALADQITALNSKGLRPSANPFLIGSGPNNSPEFKGIKTLPYPDPREYADQITALNSKGLRHIIITSFTSRIDQITALNSKGLRRNGYWHYQLQSRPNNSPEFKGIKTSFL